MKLNLTICEACEATDLVKSRIGTSAAFDAVISIEHPGADAIDYFDGKGRSPAMQGRAPRLAKEIGPEWQDKQRILTCWDVEFKVKNATPPPKDIMDEARAFVHQRAAFAKGAMNLLIHCRAGKSRSAATALAFINEFNGFAPQDAVEELLRIRPIASPNLVIVRYGINGDALAEAVLAKEEICKRREEHPGQNPALAAKRYGLEYGS